MSIAMFMETLSQFNLGMQWDSTWPYGAEIWLFSVSIPAIGITYRFLYDNPQQHAQK